MISDPQIWGENKTKAELELEFVSAENKNVVVTRKPEAKIIERSKGKLKLEFSNNSGSISVDGKHEFDQPTTQLNEKVLQHFGVREPILKYVIFCHQEDSCWPVELQNKDLIERFNQIYDTDRYERAKQNIDEIVKKIEGDIKDDNDKENEIVLYKDKIDEINRLEAEIKEKEPHVKNLSDDVEKIKQEFDEKSRQKHENNGLLKKLQSEEADIEAKCGQIHPPREECNDELSKSNVAIASIESQMQSYKESKEKEQDKEEILSSKEKEKGEQEQELNKKLEKFKEEKHIHDFSLKQFN